VLDENKYPGFKDHTRDQERVKDEPGVCAAVPDFLVGAKADEDLQGEIPAEQVLDGR
jgi:hypothetical protein